MCGVPVKKLSALILSPILLLASCSTMVTVKTLPPGSGVTIIHQNQERGSGEATFEVPGDVFHDATVRFVKDGRILLTTQMQRRISVGFLILGLVTGVALIWAVPVREDQMFDMAPYLTSGPQVSLPVTGFTDTVILRTGQSYQGVKAAVTADSVVVTTRDGRTLVIPKSGVQSVQKGN